MCEEILIPKDPLEILNELEPGIAIATEHLESNKKIMATIKINESTYIEYGNTKVVAMQAVAESALQDLFFETIKSTMFNDDDYLQSNTNSLKLLGSLAMYKLIEEWLRFYMSNNKYKKAFGISIPPKVKESSSDLLSQKQNIKISKNDCTLKNQRILLKNDKKEDKKVTYTQKKRQQNDVKIIKKVYNYHLKTVTDDNACSTLHQLVKKIRFVDLNPNNTQPPFTFSITLDGIRYIGNSGESRKEAKQNAAKKVLMNKFGYLWVAEAKEE